MAEEELCALLSQGVHVVHCTYPTTLLNTTVVIGPQVGYSVFYLCEKTSLAGCVFPAE